MAKSAAGALERIRFVGLLYAAFGSAALGGFAVFLAAGGHATPSTAPAQPAAAPYIALAVSPAVQPTQRPPAIAAAPSDTPTPDTAVIPDSDVPAQPAGLLPFGTRRTPRARATLVPAPPTAASKVAAKAHIVISDAGISPKIISVLSGGTVTWVNEGSRVHTATELPGAPTKLDSGGLAAGQTFSVTLFDPGSYHYTSAPDCLHGNGSKAFDCSGATVVVAPPPSASSPAPAGPSPAGGHATAPLQGAVAITDHGFVPTRLSVQAGGSVTWTNQGNGVHTATSAQGNQRFDTGGLASHQTASITLPVAGDITYTSAPDCLNGNNNPAFACSQQFILTVLPKG